MRIGDVLKLLGWVSILGGIVIGYFSAKVDEPFIKSMEIDYKADDFKMAIFLGWSAAGIMVGALLLAMERALGYLEYIAFRLEKNQSDANSDEPARTSYPEYGKVAQKPSLESLSQSRDYKFKSEE